MRLHRRCASQVVFPGQTEKGKIMKFLPELIVRVATIVLVLEFAPAYDNVVSGLFSQVTEGLSIVERTI